MKYLYINVRQHIIAESLFYNMKQFPRVIGAVDKTHIRIQCPNKNVGDDAKLEFLNIVVKWPGSVHDSTVFDNSFLCARFENNEFGDSVLLGVGYQ
ncbi:putative nuclease HARBI1 [Aphis craccivora]|uniref:Putative nuclease HARBI1 n=1 Tax=Aphis craccivora TaxID=307492 RepID=A0A6G0YJD4_APHCR|nr:putative nuclease HARBI1 [Aphis craccivora]